jgi:hypothetical protein
LRFYIKLDKLSGIEPEALRKDLEFDRRHKGRYGKTAIVASLRSGRPGSPTCSPMRR